MSRSNQSSFLPVVSILCAIALGAAPIPPENRIAARMTGTIAMPDGQAMHMPTDVAVDSRGRVYVADGANDRVVQFAPDGTPAPPLVEFGAYRLKRPVGLSVDRNDHLWIADTGNHAILEVDPEGRLLNAIAPLQIDTAGPADPTDIALSSDGARTYVVDNRHHRVLLRDNATRKWTALGESGRSLGQFQYPFMITIGAENYAYVTEAIGARVQILSPASKWAGRIAQWGIELGQLYRPKGIAADAQGRLFVGDSTLGVIQVFGPRGHVEGVLTDAAGALMRFQHPMGMCFGPDGRLYVVELAANRVAVVSLPPAPGKP